MLTNIQGYLAKLGACTGLPIYRPLYKLLGFDLICTNLNQAAPK